MPAILALVGLPLITSPAVYVAGRTLPYRQLLNWLNAFALAVFWFVFARLATNTGGADIKIGMIGLHADPLSILFIFLVLTCGTVAIIFSGPEVATSAHAEKYYAIIYMMIGAVIGLVCATDLFNLWVWFELMSITSYMLVAFPSDQPEALRASIKYLTQTAVGSGLILFGIALTLAQTGSLEMAALQPQDSLLSILATGLFFVGFGVKIAIVPTYSWLPDAYSAAPSGITALLSGVISITGLVALLRALTGLAHLTPEWSTLLIVFGLLNIVTGNVLALAQTQIKRIFAYSSICHTGYILLAIGIGLYTNQITGLQGGLLHILNHGVTKVLAFLAVGVLIYLLQADHRLTLADIHGLGWRYPMIGIALSLAVLSLAGIPPLAGFMSKWRIFAAGVESNQPLITLAIIFAALNSVFSLAYYLPILNMLYTHDSPPTDLKPPLAMQLPVLFLTLAVVLLGVIPALADGLIQPASELLMQLAGG